LPSPEDTAHDDLSGLKPEFETLIERLATWLARLDDEDEYAWTDDTCS